MWVWDSMHKKGGGDAAGGCSGGHNGMHQQQPEMAYIPDAKQSPWPAPPTAEMGDSFLSASNAGHSSPGHPGVFQQDIASQLAAERQRNAQLQARCSMQSLELAEEKERHNLEQAECRDLRRQLAEAPCLGPMCPSGEGESQGMPSYPPSSVIMDSSRRREESQQLLREVDALRRHAEDLESQLRQRPTIEEHSRLQRDCYQTQQDSENLRSEMRKLQAELEVRPQPQEHWNIVAEVSLLRNQVQQQHEVSVKEQQQHEQKSEKLREDLQLAQDSLHKASQRETQLAADLATAQMGFASEGSRWISEFSAAHRNELQLRDELREAQADLRTSNMKLAEATTEVRRLEATSAARLSMQHSPTERHTIVNAGGADTAGGGNSSCFGSSTGPAECDGGPPKFASVAMAAVTAAKMQSHARERASSADRLSQTWGGGGVIRQFSGTSGSGIEHTLRVAGGSPARSPPLNPRSFPEGPAITPLSTSAVGTGHNSPAYPVSAREAPKYTKQVVPRSALNFRRGGSGNFPGGATGAPENAGAGASLDDSLSRIFDHSATSYAAATAIAQTDSAQAQCLSARGPPRSTPLMNSRVIPGTGSTAVVTPRIETRISPQQDVGATAAIVAIGGSVGKTGSSPVWVQTPRSSLRSTLPQQQALWTSAPGGSLTLSPRLSAGSAAPQFVSAPPAAFVLA